MITKIQKWGNSKGVRIPKAILESLKGGLIVSCQTQPDDPIHTDDMVVKMAEAAKWAGAVAIRANSPEQIKAIKEKVDLPIIGLWKIWHEDTDVFITPTMKEVHAIWEAGAEIIALDCTKQITHEKTVAWDLLEQAKKEIPNIERQLILQYQNEIEQKLNIS